MTYSTNAGTGRRSAFALQLDLVGDFDIYVDPFQIKITTKFKPDIEQLHNSIQSGLLLRYQSRLFICRETRKPAADESGRFIFTPIQVVGLDREFTMTAQFSFREAW